MKYIVGILFSVLIFGLIACGNEGGESSVVTRKKISYEDLNVYIGSADGAVQVNVDIETIQDKDSLFRRLALYKYLPTFRSPVEEQNRISFEFLDGDRLAFADLSAGKKYISSYVYEESSLFILKDGTDKVFVANKEGDNGFFRTKGVMRKKIEGVEASVADTTSVQNGLIDLDAALKFGGFENSESMKNPKDSVIWCNVKYIYQ